MVAPLAGAWIEIPMFGKKADDKMSLPSRERGLKSLLPVRPTQQRRSLPSRERGLKSLLIEAKCQNLFVAPLAGAWIEIPPDSNTAIMSYVAPLAGAWIEILCSHPYGARG